MSILEKTPISTPDVLRGDESGTERPAKPARIRRFGKQSPAHLASGPGVETAPAVKPDAKPRIGGAPRVDLLPQSIRDAHRQQKARRNLRFGLVGLTVVVALAAGAAMQYGAAAQAELETEQTRTMSLLTERGQFAGLIAVQDRLALARAARTVGGSTEVDWNAYLRELQQTLPDGVRLTAVTVDSASPVQVYDQSTGPLQGPRVATLTFTAMSSTLPDVPVWLDSLRTLPAFVDAVPNSVTLDDGGAYLVNITMHIGADAFSGRFAANGTESE
jgi:Tfp pilus assembly protein PilN